MKNTLWIGNLDKRHIPALRDCIFGLMAAIQEKQPVDATEYMYLLSKLMECHNELQSSELKDD